MAFAKGFLAAALTLCNLPTYAGHLDSIRFVEVGVYRGETIGSRANVAAVRNVELLRVTNAVPAVLGVRFGVRYIVSGEPTGEVVNLTAVTRSAAHVGDGAQEIVWSRYPLSVQIGELRYREFHFDHHDELMPGRWYFEFWHGEKLLGVQEFCVFAAVHANGEHGGHCGDKVSQTAPDSSFKHDL